MKNYIKELVDILEKYKTTNEKIAFLKGALYGFNEAKKVFKRVQKNQSVKTLRSSKAKNTK